MDLVEAEELARSLEGDRLARVTSEVEVEG